MAEGRRDATLSRLSALQHNERRIRNICIIAHVDHGKTTLADALVASNGIISMRSAGEVRYMDSTEEEQRRGITMKSSSIALLYNCPRRVLTQKETERKSRIQHQLLSRTKMHPKRKLLLQQELDRPPMQPYKFDPAGMFTHLVNIIDSPGHVDFSCDVATAIRNCDGALVLVDVVEGLCVQTQAVIKQAFEEKLRPVLVINKIDRLVLEFELTPPEAYEHISRLLEQMNTVMGTLYSSRVMANVDTASNAALEIDEQDEDQHYFTPANGNVIFASAKDGWAFTLDQFGKMLFEEQSLPGVSRRALRNILWGDFYYQPKTGKVLKKPHKSAPKRVAERFMLARIWQMYRLAHAGKPADAVLGTLRDRPNANVEGDESPFSKEQLQLKATAAQGSLEKMTVQNALKRIGQAWFPAADAVLTAVCRQIPSPREAMPERIGAVFPTLGRPNAPRGRQATVGGISEAAEVALRSDVARLRRAVRLCDTQETESLAFVSKMFPCPRSMLPPSSKYSTGANPTLVDTVFLAFARVFCGVLVPDRKQYVLQPRWDPLNPKEEDAKELEPNSLELYLMMGRDLIPIGEAPAGNVVAIAGLQSHVHKSATLSTSLSSLSMVRLNFQAVPIVQVAVEPESLEYLSQLEEGLRLLNQADLAVEWIQARTGENILVTLGELHLKHCEEQLRTTYAKVPFHFSEPIVRFQETIAPNWTPSVVQVTAPPVAASQAALPTDMTTSDHGNVSRGEQQRAIAEAEHAAKAAAASVATRKISGTATVATSGKDLTFTMSVIPMPLELVEFLERHQASSILSARTLVEWCDKLSSPTTSSSEVDEETLEAEDATENSEDDAKQMFKEFCSVLEKISLAKRAPGQDWDWTGRILSNSLALAFQDLGGCNIFCNLVGVEAKGDPLQPIPLTRVRSSGKDSDLIGSSDPELLNQVLAVHGSNIISGFKVACERGPLCEEPVRGVVYALRNVTSQTLSAGAENGGAPTSSSTEIEGESNTAATDAAAGAARNFAQLRSGALGGQVIAAVTLCCRRALASSSTRLVEPMYACNLQCEQTLLGPFYEVLRRRRAKIIDEDLIEGTSTFSIDARLPVIESFGMADELRDMTSGASTSDTQLVLNGWRIIEQDPYFKPETEDELEEFGAWFGSDGAGSAVANQAKVLVDRIRSRKGLATDAKIVVSAEKQRTMSKKK